MKLINVEFLKDYEYDTYPETGKEKVIIPKDKKRQLPEPAARNLIRKGIVKEI